MKTAAIIIGCLAIWLFLALMLGQLLKLNTRGTSKETPEDEELPPEDPGRGKEDLGEIFGDPLTEDAIFEIAVKESLALGIGEEQGADGRVSEDAGFLLGEGGEQNVPPLPGFRYPT